MFPLFIPLILSLVIAFPAIGQEKFTVMRVIDGDTVIIGEPCSRFDNKTLMRIRLWGIDTPESRMPPGKCENEVKVGKEATAFARGLVKAGTEVTVVYREKDKYACRIVGSITLPDGRDMADVMVQSGYAIPYGRDGNLTKKNPWCEQ